MSAALLSAAARFAPGVRQLAVDAAWAGLRPWLPGGLPAIGRSAAADGLWVATGHEGAGVAHGPISARLVVQDIFGEPPAARPRALQPGPLQLEVDPDGLVLEVGVQALAAVLAAHAGGLEAAERARRGRPRSRC